MLFVDDCGNIAGCWLFESVERVEAIIMFVDGIKEYEGRQDVRNDQAFPGVLRGRGC